MSRRIETVLIGTSLSEVSDDVVRAGVLVVRGRAAMPPKRVLLPVDLSPLSADAFRHGLAILGQLDPGRKASLEAFFVMSELDRQAYAPELAPEMGEGNAARSLETFVTRNAYNTGWTVEGKVGIGFVEEEILSRMEDWNPELIVLGTRGRGGFERFLLGSVAASIVRHAGTSVLVLPRWRSGSRWRMRRICRGCGCEYNERGGERGCRSMSTAAATAETASKFCSASAREPRA